MLPPLDYFTYRRIRYAICPRLPLGCLTNRQTGAELTHYSNSKRQERANRFATLPRGYHTAFTAFDKSIINKPIADLVRDVNENPVSSVDVLRTYGKVAVKAQEKTNCVTELLLPEAETWAQSEVNLQGPLAGVPISLKDTINVKGFHTSVGYTSFVDKVEQEDGAMVKLLKDAG